MAKTKLQTEMEESFVGKPCVIRSSQAGVFIGIPSAIRLEGGRFAVAVPEARRLWSWHLNQGISCSDMAAFGVAAETRANARAYALIADGIEINVMDTQAFDSAMALPVDSAE